MGGLACIHDQWRHPSRNNGDDQTCKNGGLLALKQPEEQRDQRECRSKERNVVEREMEVFRPDHTSEEEPDEFAH